MISFIKFFPILAAYAGAFEFNKIVCPDSCCGTVEACQKVTDKAGFDACVEAAPSDCEISMQFTGEQDKAMCQVENDKAFVVDPTADATAPTEFSEVTPTVKGIEVPESCKNFVTTTAGENAKIAAGECSADITKVNPDTLISEDHIIPLTETTDKSVVFTDCTDMTGAKLLLETEPQSGGAEAEAGGASSEEESSEEGAGEENSEEISEGGGGSIIDESSEAGNSEGEGSEMTSGVGALMAVSAIAIGIQALQI